MWKLPGCYLPKDLSRQVGTVITDYG